MFKLVILLMIKSTAGHTLEVSVGAFETIEQCQAAEVTLYESAYGWHKSPQELPLDGRLIATYCEKAEKPSE